MREILLDRIEINPEIMLGKPVVKGTRLPIEIIVEKMAYGNTYQEILSQYPFLEKDDIKAALIYAAKSLKNEEIFQV